MFEIGFAVEVDPEFAPDGSGVHERIPASLTRVGAVLRTTPPDAAAWEIAIGAPNWWRAPVPSWIAFMSGDRGYIADVVDRRVVLEIDDVIRIAEAERHDLLLLITWIGVVAVGADGVAWQIEGWPDLKVERIELDAIVFSFYSDEPRRRELRIDPRDGSEL